MCGTNAANERDRRPNKFAPFYLYAYLMDSFVAVQVLRVRPVVTLYESTVVMLGV